jgi:tRNA threonylcarbamoyladenosine biosynthesis protein TsaB
MKVLALELSTARGSLAWLEDSNRRCAAWDWPNDRQNSAPFFEKLQTATAHLGKPDKIVVGLGPGSYAGIRIAISAAIGLSFAADAQLLGYPSICAFDDSPEEYAVIGDARRRSFFFGNVLKHAVAGDYELLDEQGMKSRLASVVGKFPVYSSDVLPQFDAWVEERYPSAETLSRLALEETAVFSCPPLEPIYLREPNITMPKKSEPE